MLDVEIQTLSFDLINSGRYKAAQEIVQHAAARGYISDSQRDHILKQTRKYHKEQKARREKA